MVGRLSVSVRICRISLLFPPLAGLYKRVRTTQISKRFEMDQLESVQNFSCVESNRLSRGSLGPPAISFNVEREKGQVHLTFGAGRTSSNFSRWWKLTTMRLVGESVHSFHPWVGYKLIIGTLFWKRIATAPRALGIHPKSQGKRISRHSPSWDRNYKCDLATFFTRQMFYSHGGFWCFQDGELCAVKIGQLLGTQLSSYLSGHRFVGIWGWGWG